MDKKIEVTCDKERFDVEVDVEQTQTFGNCYKCRQAGLKTFINIEEIIDVDAMVELSIHSEFGKPIKRALLLEFDEKFICADCIGKPWEITI